jgi:hypothetical protein
MVPPFDSVQLVQITTISLWFDSVQLVQITPISLVSVGDISIYR